MNKILDENYLDIIIDNTLVGHFDPNDITQINRRRSILHVYNERSDPCLLGDHKYHNLPEMMTPMSQVALESSGVSAVQNNPYLSLYGRGILIGIVDSGIDYQHPAFRCKDNTTRIVKIWDQSVQTGPPPEGFTYGTEYTRDQINLALRNSDPLSVVPTTDESGHGTAIASIAAGSSGTGVVGGVAPQAEFLVVKLKRPKKKMMDIAFVPEERECFQETDLLIGCHYLMETALQLNRPLVICIAMGTSQGDHNGIGNVSDFIDNVTLVPRVDVVCAAGNEGNNARHYYGVTTSSPYEHSMELRVGAEDNLFAMKLWAQIPASLAIEIIPPSGETTNLIYPHFDSCASFDFIFESSKIWVNNLVMDGPSGEQLIVIRFQDAQEGIWRFRLVNLDNEMFTFNAWLPSGDLISNNTYFLSASPDVTITPPATALHGLSVTAYNPTTNSVIPEAGRGYTRNGQVKPDVAAPGEQIACAYPGGRYGNLTGTGSAAAHAAGIIALLFEWAIVRGNFTLMTGNDANQLIIRGANRGQISQEFPNRIWGYGVIDIYNVLQRMGQ